MIEMGESSRPQVARRVERADEMRERDRVRSARQRDHHPRVTTRQRMLMNEPPDTVDQLHDCLVGQAGQVGENTWWAPTNPAYPGFFLGAGGRIRTVDPALMRRVLSPTELLRRKSNVTAISCRLSAVSRQHQSMSIASP